MRTSNILKVALATALLSSCSLFKNYERPADINTDGIYGNAQSGGEQGLGDVQWRDIFTDPQLQALIEKGLANNTAMCALFQTGMSARGPGLHESGRRLGRDRCGRLADGRSRGTGPD